MIPREFRRTIYRLTALKPGVVRERVLRTRRRDAEIGGRLSETFSREQENQISASLRFASKIPLLQCEVIQARALKTEILESTYPIVPNSR